AGTTALFCECLPKGRYQTGPAGLAVSPARASWPAGLHEGALPDLDVLAHERADVVAAVAQLDAAPRGVHDGRQVRPLPPREHRLPRRPRDVHPDGFGTRSARPAEHGPRSYSHPVGDTDLAGGRTQELATRIDVDRFEDVRPTGKDQHAAGPHPGVAVGAGG